MSNMLPIAKFAGSEAHKLLVAERRRRPPDPADSSTASSSSSRNASDRDKILQKMREQRSDRDRMDTRDRDRDRERERPSRDLPPRDVSARADRDRERGGTTERTKSRNRLDERDNRDLMSRAKRERDREYPGPPPREQSRPENSLGRSERERGGTTSDRPAIPDLSSGSRLGGTSDRPTRPDFGSSSRPEFNSTSRLGDRSRPDLGSSNSRLGGTSERPKLDTRSTDRPKTSNTIDNLLAEFDNIDFGESPPPSTQPPLPPTSSTPATSTNVKISARGSSKNQTSASKSASQSSRYNTANSDISSKTGVTASSFGATTTTTNNSRSRSYNNTPPQSRKGSLDDSESSGDGRRGNDFSGDRMGTLPEDRSTTSRSRSRERTNNNGSGYTSRDRSPPPMMPPLTILTSRNNSPTRTNKTFEDDPNDIEDGTVSVTSTAMRRVNNNTPSRNGDARSVNNDNYYSPPSPDTLVSMIPEALLDSSKHRPLDPSALSSKKEELQVLTSQVTSLQTRLTLETRIRDAAMNIVKTSRDGDDSMAKEKLKGAERKVDAIGTDLYKVSGRLMEVERSILRHTSAVLRSGLLSEREKVGNAEEVVQLKRDLESAESQISKLKSTITKLENASPPSPSPSSIAELNRLKLDLATTKAENAALQEDLMSAQKELSALKSQMEEEGNTLEDKDRTIANLLSELEVVTTKMEMSELERTMRESKALPNPPNNNNGSEFSSSSGSSSTLGSNLNGIGASFVGGRPSSMLLKEKQTQAKLDQAVLEKEKLKEELDTQLTKVRSLERELQLSNSKGVVSETETETDAEEEGTWNARKGQRNMKKAKAGGMSESEMEELRKLFEDVYRTNTAPIPPQTPISLSSPLLTPNSPLNPKFSLPSFISETNTLLFNFRDLQKKLDSTESQSKSLKSEIRSMQRTRDRLETELLRSRAESKELTAVLEKVQGGYSARSRLEQIQNSHKREVGSIEERYERRLKDLEDELVETERRLERRVKELKVENERLKKSGGGVGMQSNAPSSTDAEYERKISDLTRRANREKEELEREMESLQKKLALSSSSRGEIQKLEDEYKSKIANLESSHRKEIERLQDSSKAEFETLKERMAREKRMEASEQRSKLEEESRRMEQEITTRLSAETAALKSRHSLELEELQSKHSLEVRRLKEDYEIRIEQLQSRLSRAEASLLSSKTQFFEDQEVLREKVDTLETQLRNLKQESQDKERQHDLTVKEMDFAMSNMKSSLLNAESKITNLQSDLERQTREMATRDEKGKLDLKQMEERYKAQIKELETNLAEFEAVRAELESVERDYMTELSKYDKEKLKMEREVAEAKQAQTQLKEQLEFMQRKLDQTQQEVIEARSAIPRVDKAAEKALNDDIERMQMQMIDLKSAKNELLEELDNQNVRLLNSQKELNAMKKENEKIQRSIGDWEAERKRYDVILSGQREEINSLQAKIQETSLDRLGYSKYSDEPPSTQKLRSEFRKLMTELRQEHATQISREVEIRAELESQLKAANKQRDIDMYNKQDLGTQTQLKWVTGDEPQKMFYGY
ncbi:hypothetical protein HDV05_005124 [Chytridiales sp. JEL 0842]|nr:hypothetical protein HDV05_005124 [Chytridiales sp. JEL 0842]